MLLCVMFSELLAHLKSLDIQSNECVVTMYNRELVGLTM